MRLLRLGIILLPITLVFGVAAQAMGIYAFGFLLPAIAVFSARVHPTSNLPFFRLSLLLIALFAVFPMANIWNIRKFYGPGAVVDLGLTNLPWRKLFSSQVTSGVLFSGLGLAILGGITYRRKRLSKCSATANTKSSEKSNEMLPAQQIVRWFVVGTFAASIVLTAFIIHEFVTGAPWRPFTSTPNTHPAGYGLFRTYGFYGGPLHLAGAALAWLSMFWLLLWKWIESTIAQATKHSVPHPWLVTLVGKRPWHTGSMLFAISVMQIVHILTAGGRTAIVAAFIILGFTPFLAKLRSPWGRTRLIGCFATLGLMFAATLASGLGHRFADVLKAPIERLAIWKIHWELFSTDYLLGTGHFWMKAILEGQPYEALRAQGMPIANTHNVFLAMASEVGILGSVMIIGSVVTLAFQLWYLSRSRSTARLLIKGLFLALAANALHGVTENTFFTSNVAYVYLGFFWVALWVAVTDTESLAGAGKRGSEESNALPISLRSPRRADDSESQIAAFSA